MPPLAAAPLATRRSTAQRRAGDDRDLLARRPAPARLSPTIAGKNPRRRRGTRRGSDLPPELQGCCGHADVATPTRAAGEPARPRRAPAPHRDSRKSQVWGRGLARASTLPQEAGQEASEEQGGAVKAPLTTRPPGDPLGAPTSHPTSQVASKPATGPGQPAKPRAPRVAGTTHRQESEWVAWSGVSALCLSTTGQGSQPSSQPKGQPASQEASQERGGRAEG